MDRSALWSLSHGSDAAEASLAHDALKATPALWDQLAFSGRFDAGSAIHEQRACRACGSSLCRAVDAARVDRLLAGTSRVLLASLKARESAHSRRSTTLRRRTAAVTA